MTVQEIPMLAQLARAMDEGKQEFVVLNGERVAVTKTTMERLMLKSGQTISQPILIAIIESHLEETKAAMKAGDK